MNFLAHAYLAGDDLDLIVGGVIGDWIKGPLPGVLPAGLARGAALHRAIDTWADGHPGFRASRARVSPERRRYAGVLVDIFYDHLLAREWHASHATHLTEYCLDVYASIDERLSLIPADAHGALRRMAADDWLGSYATVNGIADVLHRMSQRSRRPNPLSGGEAEFLADATGFEADFDVWLRDARVFAQGWVAGTKA